MKTIYFFSIVILSLLSGNYSSALAGNELARISTTRNADSLQLHLSFLKSPQFNTNIDKRRIDIQFANTTLAPDFKKLPPNKDIVKILTREFQNHLVISLFFRYQPQDFRIDPSIKNAIVLNITLGNEYSKAYNELQKRLKGISAIDRGNIDFTNPYIQSPYTKNWLNFFKDFEPKVTINIPVSFTPPPFPIIALLPPGMEKNNALLGEEIFALAEQGLWRQLAVNVAKKLQQTTDIKQQKLLALVYGETLARAGDFTPAYQQLYLLNQEYGDEELAVYAMYWLNLLRAIKEDPILASYEFEKIADQIPDSSPLAPYFLLSRVETALAAHDHRKLNELLQKDDIALPQEVEKRLIIRQADYWQEINEPVRAYAAYNLLADSGLIETQPHSFNNCCAAIYAQKKFREAAACFRQLYDVSKENATRGLISYKGQIARLHFTPPQELVSQFTQIESAYPDTEAHCLAEIKKNDLILLKNPEKAEKLIGNYQAIANQCSKRSIREEALFKEILLQKEINNTGKAIEMALTFLREFQSGNVRISAQALLIELVPNEIKRLVKQKRYVEALILARKNRKLFEKNWIDNKFLIDIAEAYQQLGLFDEAQKLYLYLIEIMPVEKRERFYPVMIKAALNSGNYSLLDDYTAQYVYNYPNGKFYNDILFMRLQALVIRDKISEAMALLPNPVPNEARFYRVEANVMFQLEDYAHCLESLHNLEQHEPLNSVGLFMKAECLFNTNNYESALQEYERLDENHEYREQILYRRVQLARMKGDEEKARTLLKEIKQKGKNEFWKNLAERELQYDKIKDNF